MSLSFLSGWGYNAAMRRYLEKSPYERDRMVLHAVCGSAAIEGMAVAVEDCRRRLAQLERDHPSEREMVFQATGSVRPAETAKVGS